MSGIALLALVLLGSEAKAPDYPFYSYIQSIKQYKPTQSIAKFASECGTPINALNPVYGIATNSTQIYWRRSQNLPKDVYDKESDNLATSEIWKSHGVPKIVDFWFTDAEWQEEEMFCLDEAGNVKFAIDLQWSLPANDAKDWWVFRRKSRLIHGRWISEKGHFFDMGGKPITTPQLDEDDQKNLNGPIIERNLNDFRFSKEMLK